MRTFKQDHIGNLLDRYKFLENAKVIPTTTLFPLELSQEQWRILKEEHRCPHCGNKLKAPRGRKIAMCSGKRHGDRQKFIITLEKLIEIKRK